MYDPRVVDTFLELHGAAVMPSALPAAASDRLSAVQAPLRRGVDHPELQLQAFFEFGRSLGRPNSLAELGDLVWTHFRTRLPVSAMVLYRYDRDDDSIVAVHQAGALNGVQATARIPLGERLSGWVAATGQMAINSDARLDFDEAARDQSPLRCAVSVPVASSDRSAGVLTFYASEVNAFDDSHRGIAAAAAAAIAPIMAEIAARGVRYGSSPSQNRTNAVRA